MPKRSRKLLLFVPALCWFAPLPAEREPSVQKGQDLPACPEARAKLLKERAEAAKSGEVPAVILVPRPDSLGVAPIFDSSRAAMLP